MTTIRRNFTLYTRQLEAIFRLAREMFYGNASAALRHIVDDWIERHES